jgi:hypothetical protein
MTRLTTIFVTEEKLSLRQLILDALTMNPVPRELRNVTFRHNGELEVLVQACGTVAAPDHDAGLHLNNGEVQQMGTLDTHLTWLTTGVADNPTAIDILFEE